MRRARPSAIAVLPTPGSPIRTGCSWCSREDAHDSADLPLAADDGIELALSGHRRQIPRELVEQGRTPPGRRFALGTRRRVVFPFVGLGLAKKANRRSELLVVDADTREVAFEDGSLLAGRCDDEMLGAYVVRTRHIGFLGGSFEKET